MEMSIDVDTAVVVPVNLMPLIDDTDFKTRETAIVYNQAGMDLVWNFQTTAGVVTQTTITPTTGGDYDWTNEGDGIYSIEIPATGGASINNDAEGFGWFTGICTGVLAWRSPVFCFRAAATNNALINAASLIVEIAKAVWDRVLTGATHNIAASAGRRLRSLAGATAFSVNDATPTALSFISTLTSAVDDFYVDTVVHGTAGANLDATRIVSAYDGTTKEVTFDEAWPVTPSNGDTFDLKPEHIHSVSSMISAMLNTVVDGTYNIAKSWGKRLRGIEEYQGYEGGFIYIDTISGSAGSDPYTNGTLDNPVDNLTDLNSLAASLGICCFKVLSGSVLTLSASQEKQIFSGEIYTLNLAGQNINGSTFHGANASGIATGGSIRPKFEDCNIGDVTLPPCHLDKCGLAGTITAGSVGDYFLADNCHSAVAGEGAPVIDFGAALGDVRVNLRWYSGGIDLRNMGQTGVDKISIEGNGQVIINDNCVGSAGSQIAIRGHQTRTGGAPFIAGGGAITDGARFATDQLVPLTTLVEDIDTSAESAARFTEIKGAGWTTETLKIIKDAVDAIGGLTGARVITLQLYETGGTTPIPDVSIGVWNSNQTVLLGVVLTDTNGQIELGLDDGTYKLVSRKAGYTFTVPETIVVTQNETFIKYGESFVVPVPGDPLQCNVYIDLVDLGVAKAEGVEFVANLNPVRSQKVGTGSLLKAEPYSDTTDVNGRIIMPLAKGYQYVITSRALGKYKQKVEIDTTDKDTLVLADEL